MRRVLLKWSLAHSGHAYVADAVCIWRVAMSTYHPAHTGSAGGDLTFNKLCSSSADTDVGTRPPLAPKRRRYDANAQMWPSSVPTRMSCQ